MSKKTKHKHLMSSFNLAKKLIPDKKAWKNFTNNLQSKLPNIILKFSKSIKKIRPFIPLQLRAKTRRSFNLRRRRYHHHLTQKNSAAIYVDHLFPKPTSMQPNKGKEIPQPPSSSSGGAKAVRAKVEVTNMNADKHKKEQIFTPKKGVKVLDEAWRVSYLPQIRGVDERAEEFISKFRQDMKLQREQSLLDFQEMLARGL